MTKRKIFSVFALLFPAAMLVSAANVSFTVNVNQEQAAISNYIYGTNQLLTDTENWSAARMGGNRTTGYNWENNASNAGADWEHSSDNYLCTVAGVPESDYAVPGAVITRMHDTNLGKGRYSLVTLQAAGYVSRDKNGAVPESEKAPSSRWDQVVFEKGSAFSLTPDRNDGKVYMDEFINFLVNKYGNAAAGRGVQGYSIDNEPALWPNTHPRIHPDKTGAQELITRSTQLAKAVKKVDAGAEIFGPALYGFGAYYNLQDAPDWGSVGSSYSWFIDYYLAQMKSSSDQAGRRLLDVLDVHWYPEARGGGIRIVFETADNSNQALIQARMQAPRTLWDASYKEDSWIAQSFSSFLPLLPSLKSSINNYYPGTKLAVTEYCYGGGNHISGGIAQADVLGIFGKYGVYMGTLWQAGDTMDYISAAFKLYRNYDGNNACYGNTKVKAETTNTADTSVYASITGTNASTLHIIAMNKHLTNSQTAAFSLTSPVAYTTGKVWGFDNSGSTVRQMTAVSALNNNSFTYTIPALTVVHIVLTGNSTSLLGDVNLDGKVDIIDALMTAQYYVGLNPAGFTAANADVNKDGAVTIVDALMIAQYYVGLISHF